MAKVVNTFFVTGGVGGHHINLDTPEVKKAKTMEDLKGLSYFQNLPEYLQERNASRLAEQIGIEDKSESKGKKKSNPAKAEVMGTGKTIDEIKGTDPNAA